MDLHLHPDRARKIAILYATSKEEEIQENDLLHVQGCSLCRRHVWAWKERLLEREELFVLPGHLHSAVLEDLASGPIAHSECLEPLEQTLLFVLVRETREIEVPISPHLSLLSHAYACELGCGNQVGRLARLGSDAWPTPPIATWSTAHAREQSFGEHPKVGELAVYAAQLLARTTCLDDVARHVASCTHCRSGVNRMRVELSAFMTRLSSGAFRRQIAA